MHEHYFAYLLNSLDPVTHKRVEAHLRQHPEARAELDALRRGLAPLADDATDPEPPPGLALRALARVAEHRCALPAAPAPSPGERVSTGRRLGRVEWAVAAALLLLVGGMALPAAMSQWRAYQRAACANNLRNFHNGLTKFADANDGKFPEVQAAGPHAVAGFFVPTLNDAGLAHDVSVGCPAQSKRAPTGHTLAALAALVRSDPERYASVSADLAGDYAYSLGYEQGGRLCGLRHDSGDRLPIMADCSSGDDNSLNHGSAGQNVLYVGGEVRWCVRPTVGENGDHIFVNCNNRVQAGIRRSDTVLGRSAARP